MADIERSQKDRTSGTHIQALDGVRGLAIALVLLGHFTNPELPSGALRHLAAFPLSGWVGVDLFFVLSGFLITGILLDSRHSPTYFRAFYARRVLRIFPLYYAVLAGFFLLAPLMVSNSAAILQLREAGPWLWTYTSNVFMAVRGWNAAPLGTSVFWSLAVEEQFYLIWPLVVLAAGPRYLPRICAALVVLGPIVRLAFWFAGALPEAGYTLMPARVDALAAGAFLAAAWRQPQHFTAVWRHARAVALASALVLCLLMLNSGTQLRQETLPVRVVGFSALALGFSALLALTITDARTRPWMEARPLRFLGRYSYAMYLLHIPAAALVLTLGIRPDSLFGQVAFYAVATGVTIAAALVTWHTVEKRFLRLKVFVPYGHESRATARLVSGA